MLELVKKAADVNGYVISVTGYASKSGSTAVNQKLSEDRANAVTNILLQQGHVPMTRLLAPGAMGEAHQVSRDKNVMNEAENRRVVVRVLQNKAIAGIRYAGSRHLVAAYWRNRRRAIPATATSPVPSSRNEPGSGVAAGVVTAASN